jgi:hypothetical protein
MKTLVFKRENKLITPVHLVMEDGKKLKYEEHDIFENLKRGEKIEIVFFGDWKMLTRKIGIIEDINTYGEVPTIFLNYI